MGGGAREELSIERALHFLRQLRCPAVRRAEGTAEWAATRGTFPYSPDLVAGRLRGNGDPRDFYIDVIRPTGDWYTNALAKRSAAHKVMPPRGGKLTVNLSDLKDTHENYIEPLNTKILKYGGVRQSLLLGLVMYVRVDGVDSPMPIVYFNSMAMLDRVFGLSHHAGLREKEIEDSLLDDRESLAIFSVPFPYGLAFLLWAVERVGRNPKLLLIVNAAVVASDFPEADHAVVKWLRRIVHTPPAILLRVLNESQ